MKTTTNSGGENSSETRGRGGLLLLAGILAGALVAGPSPPAAGADHELRLISQTELEYVGEITSGAAAEVGDVLDTHPNVNTIHLNSQGGMVRDGRKLRDLIRSRGLNTYTADLCASACTIAFMGGEKRYIASTAKIGFHRDYVLGSGSATVSQQRIDAVNEADRRVLLTAGVPQWFADKAYSTPSDTIWWPTMDELKRANVVTEVAQPNEFAHSGLIGANDLEKIDEALLKIPVFATINRLDAETYSRIRAALIGGAETTPKSKFQLADLARPYISSLTHQYMAVASDDAVLAATRVLVLELYQTDGKDSDVCYGLLFPHPEAQAVPDGLIAPDLGRAELDASNAVIKTGAWNPQKIPTKEEVSPARRAAMEKVATHVHAGEIRMIGDTSASPSDYDRVCNATLTFYKAALALPAKDGARLLRYQFAQQGYDP